MATEKPALYPDVWEEIARRTYEVKKSYAKTLTQFVQDLPSILESVAGMSDGLPPMPKQPISVCKNLATYASELFDIESSYYPSSDELPVWLHNLAGRVAQEVIAHAVGARPSGTSFRITAGLTYHASKEAMDEAVRSALKLKLASLLSPRASDLSRISVSHPRPQPTQIQAPAMKTIGERLDDAAGEENISHEEQAHRIGISRTVYFEVKAGRGGRRSKTKAEKYLANLINSIDRKSGLNRD